MSSTKCNTTRKKCTSMADKVKELEGKRREVRQSLKAAKTEIGYLEGKLAEHEASQSTELETMDGGKYHDSVRQCCLDLLSMNVGVWHIGSVICSVLRIAGMSASHLPSVGLLSKMFVEQKQVSSIHVGEGLAEETSSLLHTNAKSQFGRKFQSYHVQGFAY